MSDTVLIGTPDRLATLTARDDLSTALVFHDSDVVTALETITRQRPRVVALERRFAETSRGEALITRITTDPALQACMVRIVDATPDNGDVAAAEPFATSPSALDARGTRRVVRFDMRLGVPATLDGDPATLLNLSVAGAQVLTVANLKPNQRVRLALLEPQAPAIRLSASVKWAIYEMPKDGPRFRAGLSFMNADPLALTRFIETYRA